MEIVVNLDGKDWERFASYSDKQLIALLRSPLSGLFWINLIVGSGVLIAVISLLNIDSFHWDTAKWVILIFVSLVLLFSLNILKVVSLSKPSNDGLFIGELKCIFGKEGFEMKGKYFEAKFLWPVVKKIERARGMIMIYVDTGSAYIFPVNQLSDPYKLYNFVTEQYSKAKPNSV